VKISTVQTAMDGCLNGKRKGHKVFHTFLWDELAVKFDRYLHQKHCLPASGLIQFYQL